MQMGKETVMCECPECHSMIEQLKESNMTNAPLKSGQTLSPGREYDNHGHCPECGEPFKVSPN